MSSVGSINNSSLPNPVPYNSTPSGKIDQTSALAITAKHEQLEKSRIEPQTVEKNLLTIIIKERTNHTLLANAAWNELRKNTEIDGLIKEAQKQTDFQKLPGSMTRSEVLQQISWTDLKKQLGDRMKTDSAPEVALPNGKKVKMAPGPTFEEFRENAKKLQEHLIAKAEESLGFKPGFWNAFGTPGYNSDIDDIYYPHPSLSESQRMLIKVLADTAWTHIHGVPSGIQADLETYIIHPGIELNTASKATSKEARAMFTAEELSMSKLAIRRTYDNDPKALKEDSDALNRTIDEICPGPEGEKFKASMKQIAASANAFEDVIDKGIKEQMQKEQAVARESDEKDPDAYKKASITYKFSRLITLSEEMDKIKGQLQSKEKNLDRFQIGSQERNLIENEIGKLNCELAFLAGIRNSSFDESYLQQVSYNRTCEGVTKRSPGQLGARENERNLDLIRQNRMRTHSQEFVGIKKDARMVITAQDQALSPQEDYAKYVKKFQSYEGHANATNDPKKALSERQHGVIKGAKYAERAMSANLAVAEEFHEQMQKTEQSIKNIETILKKSPHKPLPTVETGQPKDKYELLLDKYNKLLAQALPLLNEAEAMTKESDTTQKSLKLEVENLRKNIELLKDAPKLTEFLKQAEDTYHKAAELEKVQRQFVLNKETSKELLMKALKDKNPDPKKIDKILDMFEPGGKFFGEELTSAEKYNRVMMELEEQGLVNLKEVDREKYDKAFIPKKDFENAVSRSVSSFAIDILKSIFFPKRGKSLSDTALKFAKGIHEEQTVRLSHKLKGSSREPIVTSGNPQIDAIMKARSGFQRLDDEMINKLHEESEHITLEKLHLTSTEAIKAYNTQIRDLSNQALVLSVKHGIVEAPPPIDDRTSNPQQISLVQIWDRVEAYLKAKEKALDPAKGQINDL